MLESRTLLSNSNIILSLTPVAPLGSLVYQNSTSQTIAPPGNTDTFALSIAPNETLAAVVQPTSALLKPTLTLIAPSGNSLGTVTATAGKDAVIPLVPSLEGGTYKFVVSGASGSTGAFTINTILNALAEPESYGGPSDDTQATAQPLDSSAIVFAAQDNRMAVLGSIQSAADNADTYSFQLLAGESATAAVAALNGKTVRFALEDDQGNVLALSQTGATNLSAFLNNFVAQRAGTYYVSVTGAVGVTYNLVVTRGADFATQPNNTFPGAQDISATQEAGPNFGGVLGYLSNTAPNFGADYYAVHANAGDNLHFATSTPAGGLNNLYPELLLFDANANLVAIADGNAFDGRNSVIDFSVPGGDAGSWTIEVTSADGSTGDYGLYVTGATGALSPLFVAGTNPPTGALVQPPTAITITFNQPVYGPSLTPGELTVNGVPAKGVSLNNANTVSWTLPAGAIVAGSNVFVLATDPVTGQSVEDVSGAAAINFNSSFTSIQASTGSSNPPPGWPGPFNTNFSVSLAPVAPLGSLVYQSSTSQTIAAPGYTDTFILSIAANETLSAIVHPTSAHFLPTLTLFAPSGRSLGSVTAAAGKDAVIPLASSSEGGTYKFVVSGAGGTTGAFTINTILNALPEPESYGGPSDDTQATAQPLDSSAIVFAAQDNRMAVLGSIQSAADNADTYSFQLLTGESATAAVAALNGKTVRFALEDDQGNVLALSQTGATNLSAFLNNFVAQRAGTYYVSVTGAVGLTYNLVVTRGADFATQPNNTFPGAQDISATQEAGPNFGGVLGYLSNAAPNFGADYYAVHANAGDNLHFATSTPAGGLNNLNPELLLFDANGNLVAIADGNAPDGRNSVIDFTVPGGDAGSWTIEVTSADGSTGDYGLYVTGATGGLSPLFVTGTTPPSGALVQPPTTITITFNQPVYGPSLSPGELTVNGVSATGVTLDNANTVTFTFATGAIADGINVGVLSVDPVTGQSVEDVSGATAIGFSWTFTVI